MANAARSKIYIAFEENSIEGGYSAHRLLSYTHVSLPQTYFQALAAEQNLTVAVKLGSS